MEKSESLTDDFTAKTRGPHSPAADRPPAWDPPPPSSGTTIPTCFTRTRPLKNAAKPLSVSRLSPLHYGRGICLCRCVDFPVTHFSLLSNIPCVDGLWFLQSHPGRRTLPCSSLGLQDIAAQNRPVKRGRLLRSGNGSLSLTHCFFNSLHGRWESRAGDTQGTLPCLPPDPWGHWASLELSQASLFLLHRPPSPLPHAHFIPATSVYGATTMCPLSTVPCAGETGCSGGCPVSHGHTGSTRE